MRVFRITEREKVGWVCITDDGSVLGFAKSVSGGFLEEEEGLVRFYL
jgi:hypothetical protein